MTMTVYPHQSVQGAPIGVQAQLLTGDRSVVERLAPEWSAMIIGSAWNEPFFHPQWFLSYLEAFEPDARIVLVEARRGGELQAVLPMVENRFRGSPLRSLVLEGGANAHSCRFDLILGTPVVDRELVGMVWNALRGASQWPELGFRDTLAGAALESLAELAKVDGWRVGERTSIRSPVIELPQGESPVASWEEFSRRLGSRFRGSLRQWRKRLEARGPVTFQCLEHPTQDDLERFYTLERMGWKGVEGTAIDCSEDTRHFYDLVARRFSDLGMLRLYELRSGGATVAMHYGLELDGTYYMPKIAYDESLRDCAPGHLLMSEVIRDCIARGLHQFDCLGDADEYKLRWTNQTRSHHTISIYKPTVRASLAYAIRFPIRDALKQVRKRVSRLPAMRG